MVVNNQANKSNYDIPKLKHNYPIIWLLGGNLTSFIGDQIYLLALPLIILSLTGSAMDMGIVASLEKIPNLLQPLSGPISDRMNRKLILLLCDIARGLTIGIIGALFILDSLSIWLVYVAALFMGVLSQLYNTAQFAAIPGLVRRDDLHIVNSIESSMFNTAVLLGPTLGGFIITMFHPGYALLVNSLSFFISSVTVLNLKMNCNTSQLSKKINIKEIYIDMKEGFKYVFDTKIILYTNIAIGISTFGVTMFLTLMIFHLKDMINLSTEQIGILLSIGGVGAILGSLITTQLIKYYTYKAILLVSFFIGGISVAGFGLSDSYIVLIIANTLGTIAASAKNTCIKTIRQNYTPEHLLGRVQATSRFMTWSLLPISSILAGVLSQYFNSYITIVIGGVIASLSTFILIHPRMRRLEL